MSRLNLVGIVVGAVITTLFSVLGAVVVASLTADKAQLEYDLTRTPPLIGEVEDARFYTLEVINTGEREVEDVRIGIGFGNGMIQDFEVQAPPALELSDELEPTRGQLLIEVPVLNPDDEVNTALLVDYGDSVVEPPRIDVRGDGVSGAPRASEGETTSASLGTVLIGLGSMLLTVSGALGLYARRLRPWRD